MYSCLGSFGKKELSFIVQYRLQEHKKRIQTFFLGKMQGSHWNTKSPTWEFNTVEAQRILITNWYSWVIVNGVLLIYANVKCYPKIIPVVHICSAQNILNIPAILSVPQSQVFTWLRGPQTLKWKVGACRDRVHLLPLHPNMDAPASTLGFAMAAVDVGAHATPSHLTWSVVACLKPPSPTWVRPGCWVGV